MSEAGNSSKPLPIVDYLQIPDDGEPYLEGHKCKKCAAIFLGPRAVCSKCSARNELEPVRLSNQGELYTYTIIHRSFPGIEVPFVSAVVDLEGGGTVKGKLVDIEPDPNKIQLGMPVEVVFRDPGQKDKEGNSYLAYFFRPRS